MKAYTYLFILLANIAITQNSEAQIFSGGNVSVSYENGLYADIAPIIGYQFNQFKAGLSPVLSYKVNGTLSNFSFGGRVFGQYMIKKGIFSHAEFQGLNTPISSLQTDGSRLKNRVWSFSMPVGAGYEYKLTEKSRLQVSVLYDLLSDKNSPAAKPQVRGGIVYNLK